MSTTRDNDTFSTISPRRYWLPLLFSAVFLAACGSDDDNGGSSSSSSSSSSSGGNQNAGNSGGISGAEWPELNIQSDSPRTLQFSWEPVEDAVHYRLLKDPDGNSGYTPVEEELSEPSAEDTIATHKHDWHEARYMVEACMDAECSESEDSKARLTSSVMLDSIGYFKASNTDAADWFGWSLALSADGTTLAVGAPREASQARGINGDEADNGVFAAGAVYVFVLEEGSWQQQAYVKASNTEAPATNDDGEDITRTNDRFGYHLSLSDDGDLLAVSAMLEDSSGTGVNPGEQEDNGAIQTGAVYLFQRDEEAAWAQTAFLKASNANPAEEEETDAVEDGADEEPADGEEEEEEEVEIPTNTGDRFGHKVAVSGDGQTVAVSALFEASSATGINGDESLNDAPAAGAVYVFARGETDWTKQAYVKASNTLPEALFGSSLAISTDGNTLAVGSPAERSNATGINSDDEDDFSLPGTGAVYLFNRDGSEWSQQAYIKPSHTYTQLPRQLRQGGYGQSFGNSLALSGDGARLAVGSEGDLTASRGTEANPDDYDFGDGQSVALYSGAVYLFEQSNGDWAQTHYLKASNSRSSLRFGQSLSLSKDGATLAVGARRENGGDTGFDGDKEDTSASRAGATYLFELGGSNWQESAYIKAPNTDSGDNFGISTALSGDGNLMAIGAHREDGSGTGTDGERDDNGASDSGAVYLY